VNEDACLPFRTCDQCTQQINCGWCGSVCVTGTSKGPMNENLTCTSWMWKNENCQAPNCEMFKTCSACTRQKYPDQPPPPRYGCGWCNNECRSGFNGSNPSDCSTWIWDPRSCKENPPQCESHNDCSSCVKDLSLECVWCLDRCLRNTPNINCSDVSYTCQETCYGKGCESWMKRTECGHCSNFCTRGNASGPLYFPRQYCAPWSYISYDHCRRPERCKSIQTCDSCTNAGCHWCPGSGCKTEYGWGCCEDCSICFNVIGPTYPSEMLHISVGILVGLATIMAGMIVASIFYAIWKYYWLRRHYFEVLQ